MSSASVALRRQCRTWLQLASAAVLCVLLPAEERIVIRHGIATQALTAFVKENAKKAVSFSKDEEAAWEEEDKVLPRRLRVLPVTCMTCI